MKTKYVRTDQRGVVLVIALVMILVLTLIGFAAVNLTSYETRISGNERVYANAFYASDGGIENFRGRVSTGEFIYAAADSGSYQVAIGDSVSNVSYRRKVMDAPGGTGSVAVFTVTSDGVAPNLPVAGRVRIEAIVEAAMMVPQGYN
jgi:hypothetical protein